MCNDNNRHTDWDKYYDNRKIRFFTQITHKISEFYIQLLLRRHTNFPLSILELGGGDSCFFKGFRDKKLFNRYVIIDKSKNGVDKFNEKYAAPDVQSYCKDIFNSEPFYHFDLCYSVGLIEHFDKERTAICIKKHFDFVNDNGLVLITFPTPTPLYRIVRYMCEKMGIWHFHDERPLLYEEVAKEVEKHGEIVENKLNWWIGLTQRIILAKKYNKFYQA